VKQSPRVKWANRVLGVSIPPTFLVGVALAGWFTSWAPYAWAAREGAWLLSIGSATCLALAVPLAFMALFERWQLSRRLYVSAPNVTTKTVDLACGLFAALLGLLILPLVLFSAYFAWVFWSDGVPGAAVYFAVVALAFLAQPAVFYHYYDRWQTRNHLQQRLAHRT
jgi:hypothetical protein